MGRRLVNIQFFGKSPRIVPSQIQLISGYRANATLDHKPVCPEMTLVDCSLKEFVDDLLSDTEYVFTNAFAQQRMYQNIRAGGHSVRFVFCDKVHATKVSKESARLSLEALDEMVRSWVWTAQVFENPYFSDGKEVDGETVLTVKANGRVQKSFEKAKNFLTFTPEKV